MMTTFDVNFAQVHAAGEEEQPEGLLLHTVRQAIRRQQAGVEQF